MPHRRLRSSEALPAPTGPARGRGASALDSADLERPGADDALERSGERLTIAGEASSPTTT